MTSQIKAAASSEADPGTRWEPKRKIAERFQVSPRTIDRWTAEGILPKPRKINRRCYYPEGAEPQVAG
jgi:predicted site-specific integrase-resolvase